MLKDLLTTGLISDFILSRLLV